MVVPVVHKQRQSIFASMGRRKRKSLRGGGVLLILMVGALTILAFQNLEWAAQTIISYTTGTSTRSNNNEAPIIQRIDSVLTEQQLETVLVRSGMDDVSKKEVQGMWKNLTSLYYHDNKKIRLSSSSKSSSSSSTTTNTDGPVVLGTERCAEFRKTHGSNITVAMAGLFNTGTNAMVKNLQSNIGMPGNREEVWSRQDQTWYKMNGIHFEVPWWKHNPRFIPPNKLKNKMKYMKKMKKEDYPYWECCTRDPIQHANVLPIVMVRDPISWRNSMCKSSYTMNWFNSSKDPTKYHCPVVTHNYTDKINFGVPNRLKRDQLPPPPSPYPYAESLMDAWNQFHQQYVVHADFPRLIVRFEDAIFRLPQVIATIQECVGAYSKTSTTNGGDGAEVVQRSQSAKPHHKGGMTEHSDLLQTMKKAADLQSRIAGIPQDELEYAQLTLDPVLMETFGYIVVPK